MYEIVVVVDGSPESDRALDWALDEAARSGRELLAVCCWAPSAVEVVAAADAGAGPARERPACPAAEARAAKVADTALRAALVRHVRGAVVARSRAARGNPVDALIALSGTADMLVLGGRHRRRLSLVRSVTSFVVRHAHCPVTVVPPVTP